MSNLVLSEPHGRVLCLILNRPEKRNALNLELCRQLLSALEDAAADPGVGAILLTARGKAFSAGMDVSEIGVPAGPETAGETGRVHEQLFTIGARLAKPLVAAVDGPALGGGMGLVANCHIVLSSERATFGLTEVRLGLWPFLVFRAVAAAVGERRAIEMALTGRTVNAHKAREYGLVHEIAPGPDAAALELSTMIAAFSPTSIRQGLKFVHETRGKDWETAGAIGRRVRNEVFESPDLQEGIRAFHEKREPKWPSLE